MPEVLVVRKTIHSLDELKLFWQDLLPRLSSRAILLMSGEVGTGKTTSVQVIAGLLEMSDVQSPSFAIHLRYQNAQGKTLDHLDLYRLKDDDDLESSGFWDLFAQDDALMVIEWAQRLNLEYLPMNWQKVKIHFKKISDTVREIEVSFLPS